MESQMAIDALKKLEELDTDYFMKLNDYAFNKTKLAVSKAVK